MKHLTFISSGFLLIGLLLAACGSSPTRVREPDNFVIGSTPVISVWDPNAPPTLQVIEPATAQPEDPVTTQAPLLDSGTIDATDNVNWSGAVLVGDDRHDHELRGWVRFDLGVLPQSNSGLASATLNLGSCSPSSAFRNVDPFQVTVLTGAFPLGQLTGNCTATYDVTGVVQQMQGRFNYMEVLIRPLQINANGQDDSVYYRAPVLWISYYP